MDDTKSKALRLRKNGEPYAYNHESKELREKRREVFRNRPSAKEILAKRQQNRK